MESRNRTTTHSGQGTNEPANDMSAGQKETLPKDEQRPVLTAVNIVQVSDCAKPVTFAQEDICPVEEVDFDANPVTSSRAQLMEDTDRLTRPQTPHQDHPVDYVSTGQRVLNQQNQQRPVLTAVYVHQLSDCGKPVTQEDIDPAQEENFDPNPVVILS